MLRSGVKKKRLELCDLYSILDEQKSQLLGDQLEQLVAIRVI